MKSVVVTGTSTGIGRAAAAKLIASGFRVFGSVRDEDGAAGLADEFGERFVPLVFDVTDGDAVAAAARQVEETTGGALAGLVNNAGIAVSGPLMHLPIDEFRRQLDVNLTGVLRVTQAFLPLLGARENHGEAPGRIVNISSISGRVAAPFVGAYAASKHGLEALSDSLRRELTPYAIKVVVLQPGRIRTPIWEKVGDMTPYEGTIYEPVLKRMLERNRQRMDRALPVEVVAGAVHRALTAKRPRTRYALPDDRMGWVLSRLLPDAWLDAIIRKMLFRK